MSHSPKATMSAVLQCHKFAIKEAFRDIQREVTNIRKLIGVVKFSVKRRDVFQEFKNSLKMHTLVIHNLDVDLRWNSTFHMIHKAYKARPVLGAMCASDSDLCNMAVADSEWNVAYVISDLRQFAAKFTENQRGQSYETLSVTVTGYHMLVQRCQQCFEANQGLLRNIGSKMLTKLKTYEQTSLHTICQLAKYWTHTLPSTLETDELILRPFLQSTYR